MPSGRGEARRQQTEKTELLGLGTTTAMCCDEIVLLYRLH